MEDECCKKLLSFYAKVYYIKYRSSFILVWVNEYQWQENHELEIQVVHDNFSVQSHGTAALANQLYDG